MLRNVSINFMEEYYVEGELELNMQYHMTNTDETDEEDHHLPTDPQDHLDLTVDHVQGHSLEGQIEDQGHDQGGQIEGQGQGLESDLIGSPDLYPETGPEAHQKMEGHQSPVVRGKGHTQGQGQQTGIASQDKNQSPDQDQGLHGESHQEGQGQSQLTKRMKGNVPSQKKKVHLVVNLRKEVKVKKII